MVKKGLQNLHIDTKTILRPLNDVDEDKTVDDWELSITPVERYSSSLYLKKHKRSVSAGNELVRNLPRVSSVPNLTEQSFAKNVQKKRWFQRMSLKRNPSTPTQQMSLEHNSAVEPPEPPPRLLFNLQWSSNCSSSSLVCNSDDNSSHVSTPTSPTGGSKIELDPSYFVQPVLDRRLSVPLYDDFETSSESIIKENSKHTSLPLQAIMNSSTPTRLFSKKAANNLNSSPITSENELSTVFIPNSDEPLLHFSRIKPRTFKTKYRYSQKHETNALYLWQQQLKEALDSDKYRLPRLDVEMCFEKREKHLLTRKFILREFYTTEINFWNQLNYTKVMFYDPLQAALDNTPSLIKSSDMELFANLEDLMRFSFMLVYRLKGLGFEESQVRPESDFNVGLVLQEMADSMVVFLRCALDYGANRKLLDKKHKIYAAYKEKLALKKETRQFTFQDYLIIPIQRITRYGLLLTDLEKHTEVSHPDYQNIRVANKLVHSLAAAMNKVQK